jgi:hypothetical protein
MSENETKPDVEQEKNDQEEEVEVTTEDEKPQPTQEQVLGIKKRQFSKLRKELEEAGVIEKPEPKAEHKNELNKEFGYGEKTFIREVLKAGPEDYDWILGVTQVTGRTLDELETYNPFQMELKVRKEERISKNAIPSGSKRSGGSTRDTVDYWVAKGEMPPADQVELRRKYVNAKEKKERDRSKFTDIPVL